MWYPKLEKFDTETDTETQGCAKVHTDSDTDTKTLQVVPFSVNKMNTQETKLQPFQHHTFYDSVTKQFSDWLVFPIGWFF